MPFFSSLSTSATHSPHVAKHDPNGAILTKVGEPILIQNLLHDHRRTSGQTNAEGLVDRVPA